VVRWYSHAKISIFSELIKLD